MNSMTKGFNTDEFRKKREAERMGERQTRKEAFVAKRRNVDGSFGTGDAQSEESELPSRQLFKQAATGISAACKKLASTNPQSVLYAVRQIRTIVSSEPAPPAGIVLAVPGCLRLLVQLLSFSEFPEIQCEAAWVITNTASGTSEDAWAIVNSGAVPLLAGLLLGPSPWELRGQAVWAIGNLSGNGTKCRHYFMSLDMLTVVVSAINVGLHTGAPAFFMRNAAWALSNFFWGTPPPDVSALEPAIPAVMALLDHKDREVRAEALWASAHFANGGDDRIQASIDSGLFSKVLSELGRQDPETQGPCLRMVDIVLTGTVSHVKRAVEAGVVPLLLGALESARGIALRDACRGISRVAAMGNEEYTEVLARSPFIMRLYEILVSSSNTGIDNDGETRAEVGWIFANIATYTTEKQLSQLDLKTLTNALGKCATIRDSQLINAAVSGIERVLEMGEHAKDCGTFRTNPVLEWLREVGAFEAIKALESHPRREIAQRCSDLVTRYFCGASNFEDESEDVVLS